MRKIYPILILLLLAGASHAQPPSGFNLIRSTDYPQGHLRDLIVKEDTIIGYGIGFKDTTYQEQSRKCLSSPKRSIARPATFYV